MIQSPITNRRIESTASEPFDLAAGDQAAANCHWNQTFQKHLSASTHYF
jgi:hypothetical protein